MSVIWPDEVRAEVFLVEPATWVLTVSDPESYSVLAEKPIVGTSPRHALVEAFRLMRSYGYRPQQDRWQFFGEIRTRLFIKEPR